MTFNGLWGPQAIQGTALLGMAASDVAPPPPPPPTLKRAGGVPQQDHHDTELASEMSVELHADALAAA